ncbi:hypothetical protein [Selenomonas ruminantium]|uniref:Uncharacterized protein n=1 Tax=Selenomonas ruminantium TaxID=971 RepID=A0A1K1NNY3_SELRU|nr:hypothetical protein [Selenomonas ruminantium]SFW36134.1 hypothetical protein SAMN02910323_1470 [Selenomonas ruminantium]
MEGLSIIVDASGSLLADARVQVAGACLSILLQAGIVERRQIYRWQQDITPWPQEAWGQTGWEAAFGGSCSLSALTDFAAKHPGRLLVISDGYVFYDAEMAEQRPLRRLKGRLELLLLEQERSFLEFKRLFEPEAVHAPEEILVVAERLRAGERQPLPVSIESVRFFVTDASEAEQEAEEDEWT